MDIEGWTELCLGEILCSKNDKSKQVKSSEYQLIGLYPIIDQSSDFICGYCDDSKKVINNELPYTIFGDHTRHTKFVNFPFVVGADGTQIIKPIQSVDDRFFFYLVSDAANKIGNYGYDRHFKHLREFRCIFPIDKKEQTQIAEVLSTIDRAIAQTEAIIAKQQRIKTGLMQDLLTKGIDENGNIRSEDTHQFKDSAIGRIPVEWEVEIIGKIASLQRGHDITEVEFIAGEYPVISSSGIIGFHNISTSDSPNVVVGRKGSIGNVYYIDVDFWAHDTSLYVTNFFGNNKKYIYYLFSYLELERFGTKSGSPSLNRNDIHPLKNSLPTPSEQERISKILTRFDNSISNLKSSLNKLQCQKTGLMQDLLTGKVRVTNLLN